MLFSRENKSYIYTLCHSSTLTWHRKFEILLQIKQDLTLWWALISWRRKGPGHQQTWYLLCWAELIWSLHVKGYFGIAFSFFLNQTCKFGTNVGLNILLSYNSRFCIITFFSFSYDSVWGHILGLASAGYVTFRGLFIRIETYVCRVYK